MKYNLKTINDNAKRRKIRPKIVKQFSQFVQFHCELIQLSFFIQKYFRSLMIKHNAKSNVRCFLPFLFQFQVDSWLFELIEDDFHNYFYIWNCCHLWDDAIVKHENGWVFRTVCLRVECDSKMFLIRVAGNIGGVITFYQSVLGAFIHFCGVRIWWTIEWIIRRGELCVWPVPVVFVPMQSTTNASNFDIFCSKTRWISSVWEHFMWPNYTQKCDQYSIYLLCDNSTDSKLKIELDTVYRLKV